MIKNIKHTNSLALSCWYVHKYINHPKKKVKTSMNCVEVLEKEEAQLTLYLVLFFSAAAAVFPNKLR